MIYIAAISLLSMILVDFDRKKADKIIDKSVTAKILCSIKNRKKFKYENVFNCSDVFKWFGNNSLCSAGCLGLLSCKKICPINAISESLLVDLNLCNGCGLCMKECPVNLIIMTEKDKKIFIKCRTAIFAGDKKDICLEGCSKCYICLSECGIRAISVDENGLPAIDYSLCNNCLRCMKKCPAEVIKQC